MLGSSGTRQQKQQRGEVLRETPPWLSEAPLPFQPVTLTTLLPAHAGAPRDSSSSASSSVGGEVLRETPPWLSEALLPFQPVTLTTLLPAQTIVKSPS